MENFYVRGESEIGFLSAIDYKSRQEPIDVQCFFLAFDFRRFYVVIRFFIPASTANDLWLRSISIPYLIHYIIFLSYFLRKSQYFPFECWVITSLVCRGPWLGIEPGTSRTRSQHYTTTHLNIVKYFYIWSIKLLSCPCLCPGFQLSCPGLCPVLPCLVIVSVLSLSLSCPDILVLWLKSSQIISKWEVNNMYVFNVLSHEIMVQFKYLLFSVCENSALRNVCFFCFACCILWNWP